MNGRKAKALRRKAWTMRANSTVPVYYADLKKKYRKGVPLGVQVWYPRAGRDWRLLLQRGA